MGDRANIVVLDDEDRSGKIGLFLYTHWSGSELPALLKAGLDRAKDRWQDTQYLARILFQAMLDGDEGTTGYGISTSLGDNSYPLLVVDVPKQTITEYPEKTYLDHGWAKLADYKGVPIASYSGQWSKRATAEV